MSANQPRYHCLSCLDGSHRTCSIIVPSEWEGVTTSTRCACRRCSSKPEPYGIDVVVPKPVRVTVPEPRLQRRCGRPVSRWTEDKVDELVRLQAEGLTSRQIGERVGSTAETVRQLLMKARRAAAAVAVALVGGVVWQHAAAATSAPSSRYAAAVVAEVTLAAFACDYMAMDVVD